MRATRTHGGGHDVHRRAGRQDAGRGHVGRSGVAGISESPGSETTSATVGPETRRLTTKSVDENGERQDGRGPDLTTQELVRRRSPFGWAAVSRLYATASGAARGRRRGMKSERGQPRPSPGL